MAKMHRRVGKRFYPYDKTPGDARLYLLKTEGRTKPFTILAEFDAFLMFDDEGDFRNRTFFEISTTQQDFGVDQNKTLGEILMVATHVAVTPQNFIYSIREADEVDVVHMDFGYRVSGRLSAGKFNLADNV